MVDIQSKEVIDKISDELKVQPAMEIPRALAKDIQLVYEVNPTPLIQTISSTVSDGTAITIFTTSAVKDTFMVGLSLSVAKDVLATSLFSRITARPFGQAANLEFIRIRYEPVTVGDFIESLSFPHPIKLARGSPISLTNSTAVGSIDTTGIIFFYETDPQ